MLKSTSSQSYCLNLISKKKITLIHLQKSLGKLVQSCLAIPAC